MAGDYPATKRWLADMGVDRRRAYDARKRQEGLRRVSILVPDKYADDLKTFGRLLRDASPSSIEHCRRNLEDYMADTWAMYDEDVAAGRFDPDAND